MLHAVPCPPPLCGGCKLQACACACIAPAAERTCHVRCPAQPNQAHDGPLFVTASVADSVQPHAGGTTPFLSTPALCPERNPYMRTLRCLHTLCKRAAYLGAHRQTLRALQPACRVVEPAAHLTRLALLPQHGCCTRRINQSVADVDTLACRCVHTQHSRIYTAGAAAHHRSKQHRLRGPQVTAAAAQAALCTHRQEPKGDAVHCVRAMPPNHRCGSSSSCTARCPWVSRKQHPPPPAVCSVGYGVLNKAVGMQEEFPACVHTHVPQPSAACGCVCGCVIFQRIQHCLLQQYLIKLLQVQP